MTFNNFEFKNKKSYNKLFYLYFELAEWNVTNYTTLIIYDIIINILLLIINNFTQNFIVFGHNTIINNHQ